MAHNITAVEIANVAVQNGWNISQFILEDANMLQFLNSDAWSLDYPERDRHVFHAAWHMWKISRVMEKVERFKNT